LLGLLSLTVVACDDGDDDTPDAAVKLDGPVAVDSGGADLPRDVMEVVPRPCTPAAPATA
jgi:hypothetical protein